MTMAMGYSISWPGRLPRHTKGSSARPSAHQIQPGGATGVTTGTWKAEGYTITLTENGGQPQRHMAFPWKDDNALPLPNRLYLGGTMINRQ